MCSSNSWLFPDRKAVSSTTICTSHVNLCKHHQKSVTWTTFATVFFWSYHHFSRKHVSFSKKSLHHVFNRSQKVLNGLSKLLRLYSVKVLWDVNCTRSSAIATNDISSSKAEEVHSLARVQLSKTTTDATSSGSHFKNEEDCQPQTIHKLKILFCSDNTENQNCIQFVNSYL